MKQYRFYNLLVSSNCYQPLWTVNFCRSLLQKCFIVVENCVLIEGTASHRPVQTNHCNASFTNFEFCPFSNNMHAWIVEALTHTILLQLIYWSTWGVSDNHDTTWYMGQMIKTAFKVIGQMLNLSLCWSGFNMALLSSLAEPLMYLTLNMVIHFGQIPFYIPWWL